MCPKFIFTKSNHFFWINSKRSEIIRPVLYLGAKSKSSHHEKKENRPQGRNWHLGQSLWVHFKSEARTWKKCTKPDYILKAKDIRCLLKCTVNLFTITVPHKHCSAVTERRISNEDTRIKTTARVKGLP